MAEGGRRTELGEEGHGREWLPVPEPREEQMPAVASVALPCVTVLACMSNEGFGVKTDVSQAET